MFVAAMWQMPLIPAQVGLGRGGREGWEGIGGLEKASMAEYGLLFQRKLDQLPALTYELQ